MKIDNRTSNFEPRAPCWCVCGVSHFRTFGWQETPRTPPNMDNLIFQSIITVGDWLRQPHLLHMRLDLPLPRCSWQKLLHQPVRLIPGVGGWAKTPLRGLFAMRLQINGDEESTVEGIASIYMLRECRLRKTPPR